jgi:hemolysin activation/secretion protein
VARGWLHHLCRGTIIGVALASPFLSVAASAQDYTQVAPRQPAPSPHQSLEAPGAPEVPATENANVVIIPVLKGLRFVPHASDVIKAGISEPGIDLATVPGLDDPDLRAALEAYLGRPLTFGDLQAIKARLVAYLRAHGKALSDVSVPEQDVTSGVVQIIVTEFKLGHVTVAGARRFPAGQIREGIGAGPGHSIDLERLARDLDRLNRNPFRSVTAVLAPGASSGTTDIELHVEERFPLRVYAAFDNTGTPATGRNHWSLGANLGNLFGEAQQFSYQFTSGDDFIRHPGSARFVAHSASYEIPFAGSNTLQLFGFYARQSPDVGPFFGQTGHSWQVSARYTRLLGGPGWLDQQIAFGFDHKSTDNNLAFGGTEVFAATQVIDQFVATYGANASDSWGITSLSNDIVYSPGGISGHNTDAAFALSSTPLAKADYVYDTLAVTRVTRLPWDFAWLAHASAQWANGNLLPSEELAGGGEDSVRGYDPRIINGSEGFLVRQELRAPALHPLGSLLRGGAGDAVQFLGFWDYAWLRDPHRPSGIPSHPMLASTGLGIEYTLGRAIDVRADYGWQLETAPGSAKRGGLADVAVTLSD